MPKTTIELRSIAEAAINSGAIIILKNASRKTTIELRSIASAAPGKVIFEL